jgi:5-(carboxyamino)imidazole ribonucleotide synthase
VRIGILGGGQLARMLVLAGVPLGIQFRVWDPKKDASAGQIAEQLTAEFSDPQAIKQFVSGLDFVTYEWENVPAKLAETIAQEVPAFFPPHSALKIVQDRFTQKEFFKKNKIETADFSAIESLDDLKNATAKMGLPALLKTRTEGYDGKGQVLIRKTSEIEAASKKLFGKKQILEKFISFDRELSLVAVRSKNGQTAFYPLVENLHQEGILRTTLAPAASTKRLQAQAEKVARLLFKELNYVGVLTIEFFQQGSKLLANEIATRVHNSGHWTIDGAETSQFENHLRAGIGAALGSTRVIKPTAMINLIGNLPDQLLSENGIHLHLYGKTPAPGRKLGHINILGKSLKDLQARVKKLRGKLAV